MASDLDEKLEEIYNEIGKSFYWEGISGYPEEDDEAVVENRHESVKQVKQAFIDAGWQAPGPYHDPSFRPKPLQDDLNEKLQFDANGKLKIDGREWYDRFMTDVRKLVAADTQRQFTLYTIDQAAKKAAGIDND